MWCRGVWTMSWLGGPMAGYPMHRISHWWPSQDHPWCMTHNAWSMLIICMAMMYEAWHGVIQTWLLLRLSETLGPRCVPPHLGLRVPSKSSSPPHLRPMLPPPHRFPFFFFFSDCRYQNRAQTLEISTTVSVTPVVALCVCVCVFFFSFSFFGASIAAVSSWK